MGAPQRRGRGGKSASKKKRSHSGRGIKACDPFCGDRDRIKRYNEYGGLNNKKKYVPKDKQVKRADDAFIPKKLAALGVMGDRMAIQAPKKKQRNKISKPSVIMPGESSHKFIQRVDEETRQAELDQIRELRTVSEKRKRYYKRRAEHRIEKSQEAEWDRIDEMQLGRTDHVAFNEVADCPPTITIRPRKAGSK